MKKPLFLATIAAFICLGICPSAPLSAKPAKTDVLTLMFTWWNGRMANHQPFDRAGFEHFFTDNAILRIDGVVVASGIDALTAHFQKIQSSGAEVEIVLPFARSFTTPGHIYTYHLIRSRRAGVASCLLAAGHADLSGRRIREISLVRSPIKPQTSPIADACWANT
jgi:hypothetical protein